MPEKYSPEIARYEPIGEGEAEERTNGGFVLFAEYDELRAELAAARRELAEMRGTSAEVHHENGNPQDSRPLPEQEEPLPGGAVQEGPLYGGVPVGKR